MSEQLRLKFRYRKTNWKCYNAALKAPGALTFWFDKYAQWFGDTNGKRGRSPKFSDGSVQFYLTNKCLFALAMRQTMCFVESLLHLSRLGWSVPNFSAVFLQ